MLLHLVLALTMLAPPNEAAADAAFNAGDYDSALELYLERAADPAAHRPDAYHGAHDSLLALHDKTRDPAYLCRARELALDLLTRGPFADAGERTSWEEIAAKDAARIEASGAACSARREPGPSAASEPPASAPTVAPEGPAPAPAPHDARPLRRPVARIVGGASLLGVGAGLVAGTGACFLGRARANAEIVALDQQIVAAMREPTEMELAAVGAADRRYVRLTSTAAVLGIAAGVSLITGVALLAAPPRARSRARARVRPGGLVYFF